MIEKILEEAKYNSIRIYDIFRNKKNSFPDMNGDN